MKQAKLAWVGVLMLIAACGGDERTVEDAAPVPGRPTATTAEDTAVTLDLLDGARDADGDALRVTTAAAPGHTVALAGSVATVTPAADFAGTIDLAFELSDGSHTAVGHAQVTVTAVNDAPTAASATQQIHGPAIVLLAGRDVDDDPLTYEVVTGPAHGVLSGTAPGLTYTPTAGFIGDDAFTYRVHDAALASADATVSLQVSPGASPIATTETVPGVEDQTAAVLLRGSDPDGNPLTFTVLTPPAHGRLTGTPPALSYTPELNFAGDDALTFAVSNGYASSAAATVTLRVAQVNDAPIALPGSLGTSEDTPAQLTLTGGDVENDVLTFTVSQPAHGTVTGVGPARQYTPAANYHGPDSFTFTVSDGQLSSAPATIAIDVASVDDAPVAVATARTTQEDVPVALTIVGSDADGDALAFAITTPPAHGALTGTPPAVTYAPDPDFNGTDAFAFAVTANGVTSAPATVALTVTPVNDAPIASGTELATPEDTAVAIPLVASDPDGDPLTLTILEAPADGVLTGSGATRQYTPAANATGTRTLRFRASDGQLSSTATITIVIAPVNDAPTAAEDFAATDRDAAITIDVLANDRDVDGDPLALDSVAAPAHGDAEIVDGKLVYTPAAGFTGAETFAYTASDGNGGTATAQVHLGVGPGNFPAGVAAEAIAATGSITLASAGNAPAISGDGRIIAFVTDAALVADDSNAASDIYVFDRGTRTLARASVSSAGGQANGASQRPRLSSDGRYVVFESAATNLVGGDSNGRLDVFRRDRATGATIRVSVGAGGAQASGDSTIGSISDDGNLIAFQSTAFDLVANDVNGVADVFVRDVAADATARVSVSTAGGEADLASTEPAISGDGRIVAFTSTASNLAAGDTNGRADIFVRDRTAATTTRVSVSSTGIEAVGGPSITPAVSGNGRFVSFRSDADNLVPGVTNAISGMFVRDLQTLNTTFVVNDSNASGQMSTDGRYLTTRQFNAMLIRDRFAGVTNQPSGASQWQLPALSGNGRYVVVLDSTSGGRVLVLPNPL
jgi:Tol biopolymer transport system component